jgi:hypothetical protein
MAPHQDSRRKIADRSLAWAGLTTGLIAALGFDIAAASPDVWSRILAPLPISAAIATATVAASRYGHQFRWLPPVTFVLSAVALALSSANTYQVARHYGAPALDATLIPIAAPALIVVSLYILRSINREYGESDKANQ